MLSMDASEDSPYIWLAFWLRPDWYIFDFDLIEIPQIPLSIIIIAVDYSTPYLIVKNLQVLRNTIKWTISSGW